MLLQRIIINKAKFKYGTYNLIIFYASNNSTNEAIVEKF